MADLTDPGDRLERLARKLEPGLRESFFDAVGLITDAFTIAALEVLLERGYTDEALAIAETAAGKIGSAWTRTYIDSGHETANWLSRKLDDVVIDFDEVNERAVEAMRANKLRLVREFSEKQREATKEALEQGVRDGANPRQQAINFRRSIGLTKKQVQWVNNYRKSLESGSVDALQRQLRDRRFDAAVRRHIDGSIPLTSRDIDKLVERYRERMIKYRSEVIARTEALTAVHESQQQTYFQAIQDGIFRADQLEREWATAKNERVRASHRPMHNQTRGIDEPFISGNGNEIRFPTDPQAPADDRIQCRCTVSVRITDLSSVRGPISVGLEATQ